MSSSTRNQWRRLQPWFFVYCGTVAVVAVLSGIIWNRMVVLPSYVIDEGFRASLPESGMAQLVATDVYFSLVGVVAGLILGITTWILFHRLEWISTLIAAGGGLLAGLIARQVGEFIGPRNFEERIAQATKGDLVRIDFDATTWVPLALWVGMAVLPILFASLFRREKWVSHVPSQNGSDKPTEQLG